MTEPRPDTGDYDLLTFGEVAARLSEVLAAATAELDGLRKQSNPDAERIRRLEQRIELLKTSSDRYRQEQRTNESFRRRFGSPAGPTSSPPPQWR